MTVKGMLLHFRHEFAYYIDHKLSLVADRLGVAA
jgi:hypothetical protein